MFAKIIITHPNLLLLPKLYKKVLTNPGEYLLQIRLQSISFF